MKEGDFFLFTDGSGHQNGFGGWAALVLSKDREQRNFRMGMMNGTSTDRMEMTALIEGLHMTLTLARSERHPGKRLGEMWKPVVQWHSDRESLVRSALGAYGRNSSLDLWGQFDWFAGQLDIHPNFVTRETDSPFFVAVDLHASTGYQIIKNYFESVREQLEKTCQTSLLNIEP